MVDFREATKGTLKNNLPFYLSGEERFCTRDLNVPGNPGQFWTLGAWFKKWPAQPDPTVDNRRCDLDGAKRTVAPNATGTPK